MKKFLVYILSDPSSKKPFYVGKGMNHRPYVYMKKVKHVNFPRTPVFLKVYSLYKKGLKPVVTIYKSGLEEKEAFGIEIDLIKQYGKRINGGLLLNLTDGGEGVSGLKIKNHRLKGKHQSSETKERIRKTLIGFKHSKKTKKILSQQRIGNKRALGKKHSIEANKNKSLRLLGNEYGFKKGHKHSDEVLKIISETSKGRKPMLGKKHSEETKIKMSSKHFGKKKIILICPHCNLQGGGGAMKQWHFNNCKIRK